MRRRYQPLTPVHAAALDAHARRMRSSLTPSELLLWSELAGSRQGVAFRRQYVVGRFVADFAAPACRIIVEVDGRYHARRIAADASRDAKLHRLGWRVLRFSAAQVTGSLPAVVAAIRQAIGVPA